MSKEKNIRILIADDHPIFRDGLRRLLESEPDLEVVAEARDGDEAIKLTAAKRPDVLLLDLAMPKRPGMEALRELAKSTQPVRILLLTAAIENAQLVEALQLGARGVVLKDSATDLLLKAIRTVMNEQFWVGRESVSDLVNYMRNIARATIQPKKTFGLTPRERQVVAAVVEGLSNREIGQRYSLSEDTVKHHITNVFNKTGVSTRLELALFALHHRLIDSD